MPQGLQLPWAQLDSQISLQKEWARSSTSVGKLKMLRVFPRFRSNMGRKKMFPNSFHMFLVFRCHDSGCVQGGVSLPRHRSQWVEKWWWHFMTSWCGCFGPVYIFIVYPFFLTSTMHQQQRSAKITVRGMTLSLLQTSETSPRTCQELLKNGQNQH